jgi:hypothetical protein
VPWYHESQRRAAYTGWPERRGLLDDLIAHPDGPTSERPYVMIMALVHGDDEVELARWHEDAEHPHSIKAGAPYLPPGTASPIWTLGGLRRETARPLN